ncbi:MAG: hypothetical protein HY731_02080 [Candidatus Tectomicrobia bacterium]|nr:hypothetical protein [Candidatus Tectomicrobia bacterium]
MIITRNLYFALPGKEDDVLAVRKEASQIRLKLGLPQGRILRRLSEKSPGKPDVVWECEFKSMEDREKDMAALDASPEFTAVRQKMGALLAKFEREVLTVEEE